MYEENKGKIGRFNGATGRREIRREEGSECFCEDDGRFANGRNRDTVVHSEERVLGSFMSAEKGRVLLQGDCVKQLSPHNRIITSLRTPGCHYERSPAYIN